MATQTNDMGLPSMSDINEMFPASDIPEFDRKYRRRQGPASTKKDPHGRTFTIGGQAANQILQVIFADLGFTRGQIAHIVHCSPSRVTEVIWGLEEAVRKNQIESFPEVPRTPRVDKEETADEA